MPNHKKGGRPAVHGLSRTTEYKAWQQMRLRCIDQAHQAYERYGGRGIRVCDRWLNSVESFIADMGPKPSPVHELDRYPNNDGNYEPGNCRWATRSENDRNRRSNRLITCRGETLTLVAWAERCGGRSDTISDRLGRGWEPERAIFTPARPKAKKGQGLKDVGNACSVCGGKTFGVKCRVCENRSRSRDALGRIEGEAAR